MKKILCLILGLTACFAVLTSFKQATDGNLSKQLVGEWRNVYVKIIVLHPDKQPEIVEADSSNWEQQLGIKPIRTHFKQDGTYSSEYRNLKDSVVKTVSGKWVIKNDSLSMFQLKPSETVLKLHISIIGTKPTFSGLVDIEGDGLKDDDYYGQQRKFDR